MHLYSIPKMTKKERSLQHMSFALYLFLCICFAVLSFGVCISQTTDLYRDFRADATLVSAALKIARGEVGIREKGHNRGEVVKYQKSVGNPIGSPYCYSGIYFCFDSASRKLKKKNFLLRTGLASAGRLHLEKKAVNSRKLGTVGLVFWQYPRQVTGHVELFFQQLQGGWVRCVGFNTGGNNPRDGGGVKYTVRNIQHPLARMQLKRFICFV